MSTGRAYDGAFVDEATVAAAARAGAVAFNHYLTGTHSQTSCSPALAHKHGLGSFATYERQPGELVDASRKIGNTVGELIAGALQSGGWPPGSAVYASVDVSIHDPAICDNAFLGIADVLAGHYSLRCYGQGSLLKHLAELHLVDGPGWLSGSKSFPGWAAAEHAPYVCLVQGVGSDIPSTDRNTVTNVEALGAWWPAGSPFDDWLAMATEAQIKALLDEQAKTINDHTTEQANLAVEKLTKIVGYVIHPDPVHRYAQEMTGPIIEALGKQLLPAGTPPPPPPPPGAPSQA